jgi:hypothetical protein
VEDGVGVHEAARTYKISKTPSKLGKFVSGFYDASSQNNFAAGRINVTGFSFGVQQSCGTYDFFDVSENIVDENKITVSGFLVWTKPRTESCSVPRKPQHKKANVR